MIGRIGFAILMVTHAGPLWSAWLGICPGPGAGTVLERYSRPDGSAESLVIAREPQPGCNGIAISDDAGRVQWARLIAPQDAAGLAGGITLRGIQRLDGLEVSEVAPSTDPAPRPRGTPAGAELLPFARVTTFGAEERADSRASSSGIAIGCRPGTSPAGVVIAVPEPDPAGARLALRVKHRAQGVFAWGISDAGRAARGDPLMLGSIQGDGDAVLALPASLASSGGTYSFTVACPPDAAQLEIASFKLEQISGPAPRRAFWAWQPEAWLATPGQLLDRAERLRAGTIYVTVPVVPDSVAVRDPQALSEFVALASARGIAVWAVAGDPRAVLPAERPALAQLARAYATYNSAVAPASRLSGVQFDIEPYLNPGYQLDVDGWLNAYLETIAELKRETPVPLEVAVPFWWADQKVRGVSLFDRLAPSVDSIAVMNYRTDPALIRRFAEPFLAWGARSGRRVRIALESGPIPDEIARHYRPAATGQLRLVPLDGRVVAVLTDGVAANPAGLAFAYTHQTAAAGRAITFRGRTPALIGLLPELESAWSAWPSFAGIALHEPEIE
jgi:hypothetical protein